MKKEAVTVATTVRSDEKRTRRNGGHTGSQELSKDYMLAGCVCTSYTRTLATDDPSKQAAKTDSSLAIPLQAPSKTKLLPSVGAWRQTWLHRAPPIDRLSNGIEA